MRQYGPSTTLEQLQLDLNEVEQNLYVLKNLCRLGLVNKVNICTYAIDYSLYVVKAKTEPKTTTHPPTMADLKCEFTVTDLDAPKTKGTTPTVDLSTILIDRLFGELISLCN